MKKTYKAIKKVFDVLCWILVGLLVVFMLLSLNARLNNSIPSIFGYSVYRVSSGSMEPELSVNDVILSKEVDDVMELKVGDIITYKGSGNTSGMLITHEVIVAPVEEDGVVKLQTQGIANEIPDDPIYADDVVSVYVKKLPILNKFYDFFFSMWGLVAIIGLIIFVFIDELIVMIRTISGNDKKPDDINEIIERLQSEKLSDSKKGTGADDESDEKSADE